MSYMATVSKKSKNIIQQRKWAKMTYIWFSVHCLAEHSLKFVKYQFTRFFWLTGRNFSEETKFILKLFSLTWRRVLRKTQWGLSNREKLRECLIFDSGCTGCQSTPQNQLNINLPNLVHWLQETLGKEQKLFSSYSS